MPTLSNYSIFALKNRGKPQQTEMTASESRTESGASNATHSEWRWIEYSNFILIVRNCLQNLEQVYNQT